MSNSRGILYLIPVTLGGDDAVAVLPARTLSVLRQLTHFVVENAKSARQFLKSAQYPKSMQSAVMAILDEHTPAKDVPTLLSPLLQGIDCGVMSEAGCPAIADPGASLVRHAHEAGIKVVPLVGPSSIFLALMASGLAGQRFAFHGYLPIPAEARKRKLRELENDSEIRDMTQIFIEAPYRNSATLQSLLNHCKPDTLLCIAVDLTMPTENIETHAVEAWKANLPNLERRPAIFLLHRKVT